MRRVVATSKLRAPKFEPAPDWPRHNRVAAEFVGALLQRDPQQRCSAEQALNSVYLSAPKPMAHDEYQDRKREIERRNASIASAHRAGGTAYRGLDKVLLRLQSSTTVRSFR